jgi:hypothetical protein
MTRPAKTPPPEPVDGPHPWGAPIPGEDPPPSTARRWFGRARAAVAFADKTMSGPAKPWWTQPGNNTPTSTGRPWWL